MQHRSVKTLLSLTLIACFQGSAIAQSPPTAPAQRPNVIVLMLDDVGFAQLSSYGGLVETPNIDRVAQQGLRFLNYRTTPICSSSRAAMLTGRQSHSVNIGGHSGAPLPLPGYNGIVPASAGTVAANLKAAGYYTIALGKWDHLPNGEMTQAGPFTRWPTGQGFDKFYGFISADADNWEPVLVDGTSPVTVTRPHDYHLNDDLAARAIQLINARRSREVPPPFFMYFATGTAHAPHHAPKAWIEHYKGRFDMGWDQAREQILKRQIAEGLMPKGTQLAPRPEGMPAWDMVSAANKRLYARQMEVFAAAVSHADEQFGKVLKALATTGELDNTLVVVTSDNGASAEGQYHGTYNETLFMNGYFPTAEENLPFIDQWGGPKTQPHYAMGWAVAGNTPLRNYKQTTHDGGIRVPLVVSWPKGIAARGEVRNQFAHVADITPTILELTAVPLAKTINDVPQAPMEGNSLSYTFAAPKAPSRAKAQYFEMYGNQGLWSDGWTILTSHRLDPWRMDQSGPINKPWELYHVDVDPGQTQNLADKHPEKVKELAAMFDEQAKRYNVYPISNFNDSRTHAIKEFMAEMGRRKGVWTFAGPVSNVGFGAAPPIFIRPYRATAQINLAKGDETGPIFAAGGSMGGMALYLTKGVPAFAITDLAGKRVEVKASQALATGTHELVLTVERPAPKPFTLESVKVTISLGNQPLVSQDVQASLAPNFGIAETFDIGVDQGSAIGSSYPAQQTFPGHIGKLEFSIR
jgi:arylsulfatase